MSSELEARFVKRFAQGVAVEADLRRSTDRFSVTVLFGPSGSGKTTTLRCLAGLERPEEGHITFEQSPWFEAKRGLFLSPQQRDIGYLFQEYALFPHLSVAGNIAFGLGRLARSERRQRVSEMLDLFRLTGLENRYPHQVSGGEQQRIALARVLARRPRLLLLDEPLSALDEPTREPLLPELRRLLEHFGILVILVTHDRIEATSLADHLIVLHQGKVRQQGAVEDVLDRPADLETARIVGVQNVLPGRVVRTENGLAIVAVGDKQLIVPALHDHAEQVFVGIRAEDLVLRKGRSTDADSFIPISGVIDSVTPEGPLVRVTLDCGFVLQALVSRHALADLKLRERDAVTALVKASSVRLLDRL